MATFSRVSICLSTLGIVAGLRYSIVRFMSCLVDIEGVLELRFAFLGTTTVKVGDPLMMTRASMLARFACPFHV